jgi:hypothetical protein
VGIDRMPEGCSLRGRPGLLHDDGAAGRTRLVAREQGARLAERIGMSPGVLPAALASG